MIIELNYIKRSKIKENGKIKYIQGKSLIQCDICNKKRIINIYRAKNKNIHHCSRCANEKSMIKRNKITLDDYKILEKIKDCKLISNMPFKTNMKCEWKCKNGKASQLCRSFVHRTLNGELKSDKSYNLLGYDKFILIRDIENKWKSWMNWNNFGNYSKNKDAWNIDHIISIKIFLDLGISSPKIVNCLHNLRPIKAELNYNKNIHIDDKELFLITKEKIEKEFNIVLDINVFKYLKREESNFLYIQDF